MSRSETGLSAVLSCDGGEIDVAFGQSGGKYSYALVYGAPSSRSLAPFAWDPSKPALREPLQPAGLPYE